MQNFLRTQSAAVAITRAEVTLIPFPSLKPVELWPIDRPQPHPKNARTHSEEQVALLASSVQRHQLLRAVIVDEHGFILAGHGLLQALRRLGSPDVPVQVVNT